jgi:molybdate transport system substrate-binding protein
MKKNILFFSFIILSFFIQTNSAFSNEIRVAVASNFIKPMRAIVSHFKKQNSGKIILIFGSTGKLYAQIKHGAPFDLFFSADRLRAKQLELDGIAIQGSRFTYAIGQIVLWSPQKNYVDSQGKVLFHNLFQHLAIANPRLAPYGKAAQQTLQKQGLWRKMLSKMIRGENIGQTFQFVRSGNVPLGFVAYSQIKQTNQALTGSYWLVPKSFYQPIQQQAVLLKETTLAEAFLQFVKTNKTRKLIQIFGYLTP